jgi:hypothetical protein
MLTVALLVAVSLMMQTTGMAIDLDYSGPINSFTGEPANESGVSGGGDMVPITSGVYYDRVERAYIYDLGGASGANIASNVMDGMVVNETVYIEPSQDLDVRLYRGGNPVEDADLTMIETPGQYALEARVQGERYVRIMSFTIVGATTGLVSVYPMPAGFVIKNVELNVKGENGEWVAAQPNWDRSKVSMSEDGAYRVQYECARNGLSYNLQTIIDHTPPALALENVVNGLAKGPVDISDLEEGCKIGITLNGGRMGYREELTLNGDYEIIVQDEAGNVTHYSFTILPYFDLNSWIFFGLVILVIAGTGGYLYLERKRVRVR